MVATLVKVILPRVTGVPKDQSNNDFVFNLGAAALDEDAVAMLLPVVTAFYNTAGIGATQQVAFYIGAQVPRGVPVQVHFYQVGALDGSVPMGPPRYIRTFTLGAQGAGGGAFPSEVALVGSYHAENALVPEHGTGPGGVKTRPKARYRGRIYLGPLGNAAGDLSTGEHRPNVAIMADLKGAMETLAVADVGWSVWSRVDATLRLVIGGWVDNSWDTQRRRGPEATSRVQF